MVETDYLTFAYAFIVLTGGVIGFLKKGSFPSLVAGIVFSALIAFGATQTSRNPKNIWIVLIASSILTLFMGSRYFKSKKFMPAGLVCFISILNICRHVYVYRKK